MIHPLAAAFVVRHARRARAARELAAVHASIPAPQRIPPPRPKPGAVQARRGVASSGGGVTHGTSKLAAQAAAQARKNAPPRPAPPLPGAPLPAELAAWQVRLASWLGVFARLGTRAGKPPEAPSSAIFYPAVEVQWLDALKHWELAGAASSRPDPGGEPADQTAWLNAHQFSPIDGFPEFGWGTTGNKLEARAFVQRSSSDWVHWYISPEGAWSYDHHYGTGLDLAHAAQQAGAAFSSALGAAGHLAAGAVDGITAPLRAALDDADRIADQAIDTLAAALPPQARPFLEAVKSVKHFLVQFEESAIDPTRVDWRQVAHDVEAASSTIPVLGTAAADIIATAEVLYDAVTSTDPLEAALRAAYDYALASVPGAAELRRFIDPVFDVLVRIVVQHQKPTAAVIATAVDQAPTDPSIGSLSPRSVAASLASFVVSKTGLA